MQTIDRPSALWRLAISGGVPIKVLERVVLGNFMVLVRGIYYMDQPSGETRLEYFDFATASPRQWLVTSERCSWPPSRPLRMAAQFSMPAWTPRLTISCGRKTSGERAPLETAVVIVMTGTPVRESTIAKHNSPVERPAVAPTSR